MDKSRSRGSRHERKIVIGLATRVAAVLLLALAVIVSCTPLAHDDARALGFVTALIKPVQTPELLAVNGRALDLEWSTQAEPLNVPGAGGDGGTPAPPQASREPASRTGLIVDHGRTQTAGDAVLIAPIRLEREAALALAAHGRLDDLHARCSELVHGDPALASFATRAQGCPAAADLHGLRDWLKSWL